MIRAWNKSLRSCAAGLACLTLASRALAQADSVNGPPLPPAPVLKSPVDSFRSLLVLPSNERRAQLASRTPEIRAKILAKIQEYQSLSAEERELRLKATELRWYLQPLLLSGPTNRPVQLAMVPASVRDLVATRIAQWDRFPQTVQQLMLTNRATPNYLVTGAPTNLPPLPTTKIHERMGQHFNQLFELTPKEKEAVLATLSDVERRQMEKTLAAFGELTPPQRQQCIISFTKFTSMSDAEQAEFLRSAARWSAMSPTERQAWRELVSSAPKVPPLPNLTRKAPPLPPAPPGAPAAPLTTNGG